MAALHSAPLRLGVRPPAASREWHGALAGAPGAASPDAVLRALPFALQLLCLALAAVLLRTAVAYGVRGWVSGRAPAA
ncbi:hypothetical protein AB0D13_24620 [Streptomyces sp. NPDC048430]|uniref:hypothetical protein n=1 Tax=Streptomyces sp. NPDC048430 TaxID=3155388 RepID=UPI0034167519